MVSSAIYDGGFVTWAAKSDIMLNYQPMIFTKGQYEVDVNEYKNDEKRDCPTNTLLDGYYGVDAQRVRQKEKRYKDIQYY